MGLSQQHLGVYTSVSRALEQRHLVSDIDEGNYQCGCEYVLLAKDEVQSSCSFSCSWAYAIVS